MELRSRSTGQMYHNAFWPLLVFSFLAISKGVTYDCFPEQDCLKVTLGDKVPDPRDCHSYYLCVGHEGEEQIFPTDNPIACPDSQYFDVKTGDCADEGETVCKDNCLNICNTFCESDYQQIVYPGNCSKYLVCIPESDPALAECPDGTFFDGTTCSEDSAYCCDNCTPYCSSQFTETSDPFNCTGYYVCTDIGIPDESARFLCPPDEYFEPNAGRCIDIDPENLCQNYCVS